MSSAKTIENDEGTFILESRTVNGFPHLHVTFNTFYVGSISTILYPDQILQARFCNYGNGHGLVSLQTSHKYYETIHINITEQEKHPITIDQQCDAVTSLIQQIRLSYTSKISQLEKTIVKYESIIQSIREYV